VVAIAQDIDRNGITGGARNIRRDQPILPENAVDQRRFADIGAANNCNSCVGALVRW